MTRRIRCHTARPSEFERLSPTRTKGEPLANPANPLRLEQRCNLAALRDCTLRIELRREFGTADHLHGASCGP